MAHISPSVYLVCALLSIMLGTFLLFHLWSFDRFRCLKWNHGPHSGAFKRLMTYSYLLSVPLFIIYAVGFAAIKYTYAFTVVPELGIMPTPYPLWGPTARNAIFPLYLSYAIAWGLEMVTHLEELCFWLFLINSGATHRDWFQSPYFKTWAVGSCVAILTTPLVTILTRHQVYKCEAYTFLTGGIGSLLLTIWFLPVLWSFPSFLQSLKQHDVETNTLVRLHKVHELNCIRVVFRFLFTVPLVILGVDGVRPHQHINDNMLATDFLGIVASIGFVVSSGITLVIFFPRSVEGEIELKEQRRARQRQRGQQAISGQYMPHMSQTDEWYISITHSNSDLDKSDAMLLGVPASETRMSYPVLPKYDAVVPRGQDRSSRTKMMFESVDPSGGSISLQPNRRNTAGDVELGTVLTAGQVELIRARSTRERGVSSLVHHWRSPIEIGRPTVSRWR